MTNILTPMFDFIGTLFDFFNLMLNITWQLLQVIASPYLLLMVVFTIAHIYVLIVSSTRKQMIGNYFVFFKTFINGSYNAIVGIMPILVSVFSGFYALLVGIMNAPPASVEFATFTVGVPPGAFVVVAIIILWASYLIF